MGLLLDPPNGSVKRFLDDRSALIEQGNNTVVAASTMPVRAGGRATDLTLSDRGDAFESENPNVPARIAKNLDRGVLLADAGVSFSPLAGASPAEATLLEGKAFWANAVTDGDVIVTPTAGGVETMVQLRSEASPEELRMPFDLPDGAYLREAADGPFGVEVVKGDERLAFVSQAIATDTAGFNVPVKMSIRGDEIVIDVPILVDPYVFGAWRTNGSGFAPWRVNAGGLPFDNYAGDAFLGRGLYTWTSVAGRHYNHNDASLWYAVAPGNSYVNGVEFHYLTKEWPGSTCTMVAIWHPSLGYNPGTWDCSEITLVRRDFSRESSGTGPYGAALQTTMIGAGCATTS